MSSPRGLSRFHPLSLLLAAWLLTACAASPTRTASVGSSPAIAYAYTPAGTAPTVVLQSGLGDGLGPWEAVGEALQGRRAVFAYDRPGYGASPAASGPRDPCAVAAELHALLAATGVKPPYVLVGHSLGGLYQYVFARLYPGEVAGLVLLDPTHPRHWQTMQAEAPGAAAVIKGLRATLFSAAARQEFDDQMVCLDRIERVTAPAPPTQILVSGRFGPAEGEAFQRMVWRLREDWLKLTGARALATVEGSGHYLQREAPARVVQAIESVSALP